MEIVLVSLLLISIAANVILIKYSQQITKKLWFISKNIGDLMIESEFFQKHLEIVYEQETYYGDETLAYLLRHAKSFGDEIEKFEEIYSIVDGELEIVADLEEGILDDHDYNAQAHDPEEEEAQTFEE